MDPVQEQVDAFNARDVERFLSAYAPDVTVEDGAGNVTMEGHDAMRGMYGTLFAQSPNLHVRIAHRIRVGEYVVDEEYVTGLNAEGSPPEMHGVAIYRVVGSVIVHTRLLA
jgi:hypothetical protein